VFILFLLALVGIYFVYQTGNYGGELAKNVIKQSQLK